MVFSTHRPLSPVLGAGWDGNPYAYAGNNPLNTTDPTGLRTLTDDELKAYDGSARGAFGRRHDPALRAGAVRWMSMRMCLWAWARPMPMVTSVLCMRLSGYRRVSLKAYFAPDYSRPPCG